MSVLPVVPRRRGYPERDMKYQTGIRIMSRLMSAYCVFAKILIERLNKNC
mgnify:CR=1 FL=1